MDSNPIRQERRQRGKGNPSTSPPLFAHHLHLYPQPHPIHLTHHHQVVEAITAKGGKASFIKSDIGIESDVQSLHAQIIEKHGHLDAAINNAGIVSEFGKIADISTAQLENVYKVNVFGVFWSMQAQVKAMLAPQQGEDGEKGKGRGGRIVNIASAAGLNGIAGFGVYASTKHAVCLSFFLYPLPFTSFSPLYLFFSLYLFLPFTSFSPMMSS